MRGLRLLAVCALLLVAAPALGQLTGGQAYRDNSRMAHDDGLLAVVQPRFHSVVLFDVRSAPPRPMFAFGRYGRQAGQFARPSGVALDGKRGLVYVSDTDNDRIEAFRFERDKSGAIVGAAFLKAVGRSGSAPGELKQPAGLAVDRDGNLFVCDVGNGRVQVFDAKLAFVRQWGQSADAADRLVNPSSIAIDRASDTVYVADLGRLEIRAFDRSGTLQAVWGGPRNPEKGVAAGEVAFPFGIATGQGVTFISDTRRQDIQKFRGSQLLQTWGGPGNEDGRFFQPEGIALLDAGTVVVIDQGGLRGQVFSTDGVFRQAFQIPPGDLFPWATPPAR